MLEFGEQEFPVKLVVIQIMGDGSSGDLVLEDGKIIIPVLVPFLDFNIMVHAKIEIQQLVQVPAQLIILDGRYDADQYTVFKEFLRN